MKVKRKEEKARLTPKSGATNYALVGERKNIRFRF